MAGSVDILFRPRSIAVVGASRNPESIGGKLFCNLSASFRGPVYPVNPQADSINSLRCFASLDAIRESVDLAFIVTPRATVLHVVEQCIARGVKGLVVITAGFAEVDAAGKQREQALRELVRRAGVPLVGPNCLGLLNTDPDSPLNGTFGSAEPPRGNVAVCTQSGALGFVFPEYSRRWRLGISQLVSIGNKLDVGENALIEYWGQADSTRVIQLYLESFQDPRRFLDVAREVSLRKPIIALKAGKTEAGKRAASSHTTALATSDAAADGLFKQAGVIRVDNLDELFEATSLLALQPIPKGNRVAVLSNAGGPGVLCVDALEQHGLLVPEFSESLQEQLRWAVPAEAAVRNPIDLIASIDPHQFRHCLERLLASDEIDAIVLIYIPRLPGTSPSIARVASELAESGACDKTLVTVFLDPEGPPRELLAGRVAIPSLPLPEAAARALARAVEYRKIRDRPQVCAPELGNVDIAGARRVVESATRRLGDAGGWLLPDESQLLLRAFGIRIPGWAVVHSRAEAVAAAQRIGYPLVAKVISPAMLHKFDAGGVVLGIDSASALECAYADLMQRFANAVGVFLQQWVSPAHEVFVGIERDPVFGTLIGCGLGGIEVEALGGVQFRLQPITSNDAVSMIHDSPLGRILNTSRGVRTFDEEAVIDLLLRASALINAVPEVVEADFNPVCVLAPGHGLTAVDVRIRIE